MADRYTWIKLYVEILHDPKMGRLSNFLWRRAVEIFLLAGENGKDGALQPVEEMAWELHSSPDEIVQTLMSLAEIGVVQEVEPDKWLVTNFSRRQAALSDRDRQQKHRDGLGRSRGSNGNTGEASRSSHDFVTEEEEEEDSLIPPTPRTPIESEPKEPPKTIPIFPEGWQAISERIYQQVTQQPTLPCTDKRDSALKILYLYYQIRGGESAAINALRAFWAQWRDKYPNSPGNMAWLTEWAVTGHIPQKKGAAKPALDVAEQARLQQLAAQKLMAGAK